jgi:hypothetical protein
MGGFSEGYFPVEDIEIGLRLHLAHTPLDYERSAIVHYRYRDASRTLWQQGLAYGAGRARISFELRERRLNAPRHLAGWRSWLWLATHAPTVVAPHQRPALAWVAGNRLGQLIGSIRHRAIYL